MPRYSLAKAIIDTGRSKIPGKEVGRASSVVLLSLLLACLMTLSFDIRPAKAGTIVVPGNYPTIQEAINHASEGDTIVVRAGTYNESIVVTKSVTLIADYQQAKINGGLSDTVSVEADNVTLVGFNISAPDSYWGIVLRSSSHTKIVGNVVGQYGLAPGIAVLSGGNNSIANNRIEVEGPGIYLSESADNLIMSNAIHSCKPICLYNSRLNHIFRNMLTPYYAGDSFVIDISGHSNGNTVEENTISHGDGTLRAYLLLAESTENLIFHNNFVDVVSWIPVLETYGNSSNNVWDNGSEGNYWINYDGVDLDGDGIGDTPYIVGSNFTDHYPLMKGYSWWNPCDINCDFAVNIFDIVLLCSRYGSTAAGSNWNFLYDIAEPYGKIDVFDLVKIAGSYGKEYTP
jgi:parallel beta-helix repeat protein